MSGLVPGIVRIVCCLLVAPAAMGQSSDWPRFRGPDGAGVAPDGAKPPVELDATRSLLWKTPLPPGHSSPVVAGERLFLTGLLGAKLVTLCLDARDGKVLWRAEAPAKQVEKVHEFNSPAAATPVADGQRVYVYFGSYGLIAYGLDGRVAWQVPLPTPETDSWGSGASPVVVGDLVVQVVDTNAKDGSFVIAVDRNTGKTAWKKARPGYKAGWATPMVWRAAGLEELIVPGSGRVVAYDAKSGEERWSVGGFSDYAITTPVGNDKLLFVHSGGPAGGEGQMEVASWEQILQQLDRNRDGKLFQPEVVPSAGVLLRKSLPKEMPGNFVPYQRIFVFADENQDKFVTREEWEKMLKWVTANGPLLLAIRPGASGDATWSGVAWKVERGLPEMPSPLLYRDRLYLVRDGGLVTCLEPGMGKEIYRGRLEAPGQYAASPVAADGRIYFVSVGGAVTTIKAGDTLEVISRQDLGERVVATPAIVGGTIFIRTDKHLLAFGGAGPK